MSTSGPTGDFVTTTLNGAITNSATTMTIGTGLEIPATNGVLQLDYDSTTAVGADTGPETVKYATYTTGTGAITGMTRGYDANTSGVAHSNGASVQSGNSAMYFQIDPSWIPANETWTYASASTFTIAGDLTDKYAVGDKIKWTQTTVKYGVIVAAAYGAPNTTITIAINTDYVVTNAAISSNFFSKSVSPVDFPGWFAWTPVATNVSDETMIGRFTIEGRTVTTTIRMTLGGSGDVTGTIAISVPVTAANKTLTYAGIAWADDNNATAGNSIGAVHLTAAGTTFAIRGIGTDSWNATVPFDWAASDIGQFQLTYEI